MKRRDCDLCHNSGLVINRRETRIYGYTCYADCSCGQKPAGWRKVLADEFRVRAEALARTEVAS